MHKKPKIALIALALSICLLTILGYSLYLQPQQHIGSGPLKLEVTSDKLTYIQGETAVFYVYIINPQNWSVHTPSTLSVSVGGLSQVVISDYGYTNPTITANSRTLFYTQTWNTTTGGENRTPVQAGNYTFTAKLPDFPQETSNCTVLIT